MLPKINLLKTVLRQFDLTASGSTTPYGPYRMRLYFSSGNPDESNGNTMSVPYNLVIYHCNGTSWKVFTGVGGSDANGVYVESTVATWSTGSTFAISAENATAITLAAFRAMQGSSGVTVVTVTWETGTELDNAGFNLYHATDAAGPYTKINATLIPARGDAVSGPGYVYLDSAATDINTTYYYKLEEINTNAVSTFHGPINTQSGVSGGGLPAHRIYLPVIFALSLNW